MNSATNRADEMLAKGRADMTADDVRADKYGTDTTWLRECPQDPRLLRCMSAVTYEAILCWQDAGDKHHRARRDT